MSIKQDIINGILDNEYNIKKLLNELINRGYKYYTFNYIPKCTFDMSEYERQILLNGIDYDHCDYTWRKTYNIQNFRGFEYLDTLFDGIINDWFGNYGPKIIGIKFKLCDGKTEHLIMHNCDINNEDFLNKDILLEHIYMPLIYMLERRNLDGFERRGHSNIVFFIYSLKN